MILVAIPVGILVVMSAIGLWAYANHDRPELIDRPDVVEVAGSACRRLAAAVAATPYDRDAARSQRVAVIRKQDRAITGLITEVLKLDVETRAGDLPTDGWLDDWAALRAARERYADQLAAGGNPVLNVPRSDAVPITGRMSSVGLDCEVPLVLARLE